jgi:hypothetical protein
LYRNKAQYYFVYFDVYQVKNDIFKKVLYQGANDTNFLAMDWKLVYSKSDMPFATLSLFVVILSYIAVF